MRLDFVVAAVAIIVLMMLYRRDARLKKQERARFFDGCLDLFRSYRIVQEGPSYPVLTGNYRGYDIRLEPVTDNMAWRRLPLLWLKVTILRASPYMGVLDFMVRPGGVEICSPSHELDHHLPVPEGWPDEALLCTDDPSCIPPLDRLTPHIGVFADPKMKELVITSRGIRLLYMVAQASRAHYGTFRELRFDGAALDAVKARLLLEAAIGISDALSGPIPLEAAA